jgi:hypothetical protein
MSIEYQTMRGIPRTVYLHFMAIVTGAMLLGGHVNAADDGPTISPAGCMQKQFGTLVDGSNRLNCTANDIKLSRAIAVSQDSCIAGTFFNLTATFEVNVTANSRYDAGFFFRTDGGASARGDGPNAAGVCSLSALEPRDPANPPTLNLDGDSCGDMNASPAGTPHQVTFTIPNVKCEAAPGTNVLKLPNCTSWHSNQGTACSINTEGDFKPDTKSKCVCDDTFTVPVRVEDATIIVTKTANPTTLPEPGGTATFTVTIENAATVESVTIDSIIDDVFGNLGTNTTDTTNTCDELIGDTLEPGAANAVSCTFSRTVLGDQGTQHKDTVTVSATQPSTGGTVEDDDDATVDFTNRYTNPTVSKVAQSTANCSVEATYQVVVNNNDDPDDPNDAVVDTLTINSLNDDKFGDLTTTHAAGGGFEAVVSTTCDSQANPFVTIDPQGNYTCSFVGRITSADCDISHKNTVTADVTDDDGRNTTPTDDALIVVDTMP